MYVSDLSDVLLDSKRQVTNATSCFSTKRTQSCHKKLSSRVRQSLYTLRQRAKCITNTSSLVKYASNRIIEKKELNTLSDLKVHNILLGIHPPLANIISIKKRNLIFRRRFSS
jgi:hypothetical protein